MTENARHSKSKRPRAALNSTELVRRSLQAASKRNAVEACKEILEQSGTAYAVGTGGSYTVAVFLSQLMAERRRTSQPGLFMTPLHPFDYVRTGGKSDVVIVISYSGSTPDCHEVIRRAIELQATRIVLLTGSTSPYLRAQLRRGRDQLITYGPHPSKSKPIPGERGFVSMARTVAPCAVWTSAVVGISQVGELGERVDIQKGRIRDLIDIDGIVASLNQSVLHVLGSGLAWPAMLDLESKFTEADLGLAQLHEMKDFSHGRFVSVLGKTSPALILGIQQWHPFESLLLEILREDQRPVATLLSSEGGVLGMLELLILTQFIAQLIGQAMNKDISSPSTIPQRGLELYRWDKGL